MNKQVANSPFPSAPNAGKHYSTGWIVVECMESSVSIFEIHLAVNSLETKAMFRDRLLNQVKHLSPTAENDTAKNQLQVLGRWSKSKTFSRASRSLHQPPEHAAHFGGFVSKLPSSLKVGRLRL
jgi:hypothetical protein